MNENKQAESVDYVVSAVLVKQIPTGLNTQNKLYAVSASSKEEAHGMVLSMVEADFPEHQLHTICSYPIIYPAPAVAQSWELNEETAKFLADLILANDEPTPVTLSVGFIKDDDGKIQHGLRVHESEYPEEGAELLVESTPSPQKSPPAELVRELVEALEQITKCDSEGFPVTTFQQREKIAKDALKSAKEHGL